MIHNVLAAFVSGVFVYKQMVSHAELELTVYQEYAMPFQALELCANRFLTEDIVLRRVNVLMAQFVIKISAFTT